MLLLRFAAFTNCFSYDNTIGSFIALPVSAAKKTYHSYFFALHYGAFIEMKAASWK